MAELNPDITGDTPSGSLRLTTQRLDYDGQWIQQVKVRESTAVVGAITPQETVSGGVWTSYRDEPISDILVYKVTETRSVPGLYVPFTRYDLQLGPISGTKRLVENSGLTTTLTATYKRTYEAHENSKVVCWELIETNSDGTGGDADNPVYPTTVTNAYDAERGDVETTLQASTDLTTDSSLVVSERQLSGPITYAPGALLSNVTLDSPGNISVPNQVINLVGGTGTTSSVLILTTKVVSNPSIVSPGATQTPTGSSYTMTLTGTTGAGTLATLQATISALGVLTAVTVATAGAYTANPSNVNAEPFDSPLWVGTEPVIDLNMGVNTFELSGGTYTVGPATFTSSGGNDATFTAAEYTVPCAVLTKWEPINQFLRRKSIAKWTLPGPLRQLSPQYDVQRGQITSTAQLVDASGKTSVRTATAETSYRPSSYGNALLTEIIEDWDTDMPDRLGKEYDDARGAVAKTIEQVVAGGSEAGSIAISGVTVTQISYQPVDRYQLTKLTETWTVPGKLLRNGERYDKDLGYVTSTRQLVDGTTPLSQVESASGLTRYETAPMGHPVVWKIVESWETANFPTLEEDFYDRELGPVARETVLTIDTTTVGSESASQKVTYEPRNDFLRRKTTDTWSTGAFPLVVENIYDDQRGAIERTTQLSTDLTSDGSLSAGATTTLTRYEPRNAFLRRKVIETWALPGPSIRNAERYDEQLGKVTGTRRLVVAAGQTLAVSSTGQTRYDASPFGNAILWEIAESWNTAAFPEVVTNIYDEQRGAMERTAQLSTDLTSNGTLSAGATTTLTRWEPYNEFLRKQIIETWTLPGPTLRNAERYDEQLGKITGTRKLVTASGQTLSVAATGQTRYDASPFGSAILWEIAESWSTSAFPEVVANFYDDQRGAVERTTQLTTDLGSAGSLTGTTLTRYEPYNEFLRKHIVETWSLPGPTLRNAERYDDNLGKITGTRKLVAAASQTQSVSSSGQTRYDASQLGNAILWEIEESWNTGAFPIKVENLYDDQKGAVDRERQLTTDLSSAGSFGVAGSTVTEISYQPYNEFLRLKTTETWSLGKVFTRYDVDDETQTQVAIETTTIAKPTAGTISGLNSPGTQVNYVPTNEFYGRQIKMTIATPPARTETHLAAYNFPALVTSASTSSLVSVSKRAKFTVNLNHVSNRNRIVPHKVEITYGAFGSLTAPTYLKLELTDLNYQGAFFNVQASNVLTNSFSITATTASDNPDWGVVVETYVVAASTPTASGYIALIGTEAIVSYVLKPWKYNFWRLETVKVKLE